MFEIAKITASNTIEIEDFEVVEVSDEYGQSVNLQANSRKVISKLRLIKGRGERGNEFINEFIIMQTFTGFR